METGRRPELGVCAAVDVHYLRTGGARAAAVLAADAAFAHVLAERTAVIPRVRPSLPAGPVLPARTPAAARGPGRPEQAGPAGGRWLCRSGPRRPTRPGCACARRVRHPGDRGGQVQVPHGYPRGAGRARILGTPVVLTAAGIPSADAADLVQRMAGRYRLPDALRRADTLARAGPPAISMTDRQPG